jgi:hypothetical protein
MKLTLTFTDQPLEETPKDAIFPTHFEFPDTALELPDCKDQILTLAAHVAQLTEAML